MSVSSLIAVLIEFFVVSAELLRVNECAFHKTGRFRGHSHSDMCLGRKVAANKAKF